MLRVALILLTTLISVESISMVAGPIGDVQTVVNFVLDAQAVFNGELPIKALFTGSGGITMGQIMDKVDDLTKQLSEMSAIVNKKLDSVLDQVVNRLPLIGELKNTMAELHAYITRIDELYKKLRYFIKKKGKLNEYTLQKYADAVLDNSEGSLSNVLNKMYRLVVPGRAGIIRDGLLTLIAKDISQMDYKARYYDGKIPQERIFDIYNIVFLSESRGYIMTVFAFVLLSGLKKSDFAEEGKIVALELVERSKYYIETFQEVMKTVPRNFESRHPNSLSIDVNYVALNNIQMFMVAELQLFDGSCSSTCADAKYKKPSSCPKNVYCPARPCEGIISYCESLADTDICELPKESVERYQFVKGWVTYGRDTGSCKGSLKSAITFTDFTFSSCDTCSCVCIEDAEYAPSVNKISVEAQMSDIDNNRVVAAVRFLRRWKSIHIQIEEAKLLSNGRIDKSAINPKIIDLKTVPKSDLLPVTWDRRFFYLDDIMLPKDYVVTGVRLKIGDKIDSGIPFQLEVRGTRFDFRAGTLKTDDSIWVSADTMTDRPPRYNNARDELKLDDPDDPALAKDSEPDSLPNQYMKLRTSSHPKDAGQHTVPAFDSQFAKPPMGLALSGLGMFHRGTEKSGGFFALRIFELNLSEYMNIEVSELKFDDDYQDSSEEEEKEEEEEEEEEEEDE